MMDLLRIIGKFFRTWFMPFPAHDSLDNEDESAESESEISDHEEEVQSGEMDDEIDDDPSVNSNKTVRRNEPEERPDFSHLVGEPENAEERYSRSKSVGETSEPE